MTSNEILKEREYNLKKVEGTIQGIEEGYLEIKRIIDILENTHDILDDLDIQFEAETGLKGKDIVFLFSAAVLQTLRWILLPSLDLDYGKNIDNRLSSGQGANIEKKEIKEYLEKKGYNKDDINNIVNNKSHINNYTWEKLLIAPVPYDAMHGSKRIEIHGISAKGKEIYGGNHHVATWGHDPLVGWIIGPLNITTRMITFRDFKTFHVAQVGDTFNQVITYKSNMLSMIKKSLIIWGEDSKKLFASVAKQGMHQKSDKYTKMGLPIPMITAESAQNLLKKGWNSYEVEQIFAKSAKNLGVIGLQYVVATIIDNIIRALHLFCYDESLDGSYSTYAVKTQKVLCYSNALAEITNVLYVVATEDAQKLDIGGYIEFVFQLIHNSKLQRQVKEAFIFGNYKNMIEKSY